MAQTTEQIYIKMNLDTRQFDNTITGIKREMASLRGIVGSSLLSPEENRALTARLGALKNELDDIKIAANNIDVGDLAGNMAKFGSVGANAVAGVAGAMSLLGIETDKVGEAEKKILQFMSIGNALQSVADSKRLATLAAIYGQKIKDLFLTKEIIAAEAQAVGTGAVAGGAQVRRVEVVDTTQTAKANTAANVAQVISLEQIASAQTIVGESAESQAVSSAKATVATARETEAYYAEVVALEKLELERLKNAELTDPDNLDQLSEATLDLVKSEELLADKRKELNIAEESLTQAILTESIAKKESSIATKAVLTAEQEAILVKNAHSLATVKAAFAQGGFVVGAKAAAVATWNFTKALLANPITWFVVALAAAAAGVYLLVKALTTLSDAEQEELDIMKRSNDERVKQQKLLNDTAIQANENYINQRVYIDKLVKTVNDSNKTLKERKEALQKLINLDPTYLKGLTLQNMATQQGVDLIDKYKKSLIEKAKSMADEALLVKLYSEQYQNNLKLENLQLGLKALNLLRIRAWEQGQFEMAEVYKDKIELGKQDLKIINEQIKATDILVAKVEKGIKPVNVEFNTNDLVKATNDKNKKISELDKISDKTKWEWALSQYNVFLYEQEKLKQEARRKSDEEEMKALEEQEDMMYELYAKRMNAKIRAAMDILQMETAANESKGKKIYENTLRLDQKFVEDRKNIFGGLFTIFDELSFDEKLMAFSEFAVSITQITLDSINAIMEVQAAKNDEMFEMSMDKISEEYDIFIKQMNDAMKYGSLTQQEYDKRKDTLDKERAKKEADLQKKQGEQSKKLAIAQATMSMAQAIIQALAQWPGVPLTIPYGLLAATLGGIQIAAIKATPIPTYGTGGRIIGPSHTDGGVPLYAEGGEFIINKSVAQSPGMGNFLEEVNNGNVQPGQTNQGINLETIKAIVSETVSGISKIPVINVESDSTRVQRKVATIEQRSNW